MDKRNTLLLSYPRSGNSWLRYIIEKLTEVPTEDMADNAGYRSPLTESAEGKTPFVFKRHFISDIPRYTPSTFSRLLFIIRDYREVIIRHNEDVSEDFSKWKKAFVRYQEGVGYYQEFDGDKAHIYYEDLVKNPEQVLHLLARFFKIEDGAERVLSFMEQFDLHFKQSMEAYSFSETNGKVVSIHKNKINPLVLEQIEMMEEANIGLLKRYRRSPN